MDTTTPPTSPTTSSEELPRPLTAAAHRQSWRELPVRRWLGITLCLMVVILSVGIGALNRGLSDRRLLNEGLRLDARIDFIAGATRNVDRSVEREVHLSFQMPGEAERRILERVKLEPRANAPAINKGDLLPILVDRKDPRTWTDRVEPTSWPVVMVVPALLTPPAVALALITIAMRKRLLRLYETGARRTVKVSETHRSALVPGQKVVNFSVAGRSLAAAYPDALGPIAEEDAIEVVIDNESKPRHALVARAYA